MSEFGNLAFGRRSIRKFEDKDIPLSEIEDFIKIASSAPSGCNSQCWKFVAIKDRNVISQIADAVISKVDELISLSKLHVTEEYLSSKRKITTFFVNAPVVVAVFMTKLEYYDPTFVSALENQGYNHQDMMSLVAYPDILSIGAAIENLLLAVHEKGYGACWMNEPAIAGEEIKKILGVPDDNKFMSLIPIGVPAYTPRDKKMKDFSEIFRAI